MNIEDKPPGNPPFETPFAWIGGESQVHALVDRFYDLMDLEPGYAALRAAHGPELPADLRTAYDATWRAIAARRIGS